MSNTAHGTPMSYFTSEICKDKSADKWQVFQTLEKHATRGQKTD